MPVFMSSISTLIGATRINRSLPTRAAIEDLGGKVAVLISSVNLLNERVSALQAAVVSAANSGVTFSAFSTAPTSTFVAITNFSTT